VTKLSGVDKYKEYAALQMEAALTEQQALVIGRDLVNYVLGVIADARSGKSLSLTDAYPMASSGSGGHSSSVRGRYSYPRSARL
jgi:hypothetical protein